jgi:hypothetical protein
MTANQLIAMSFPLLTAAAVGLTGLFIRKPWAEKRAYRIPVITEVRPVDEHGREILAKDVKEPRAGGDLERAERLLRSAQEEIQRARAPAS